MEKRKGSSHLFQMGLTYDEIMMCTMSTYFLQSKLYQKVHMWPLQQIHKKKGKPCNKILNLFFISIIAPWPLLFPILPNITQLFTHLP